MNAKKFFTYKNIYNNLGNEVRFTKVIIILTPTFKNKEKITPKTNVILFRTQST